MKIVGQTETTKTVIGYGDLNDWSITETGDSLRIQCYGRPIGWTSKPSVDVVFVPREIVEYALKYFDAES